MFVEAFGSYSRLSFPGTRTLGLSDIIALLAVIVGVLAWQYPRSPKAPKRDDDVLPPIDSEPNLERVEVSETVNIQFPPGLFLYDYVPGIRLRIRECTPIRINKFVAISAGGSFLVTRY